MYPTQKIFEWTEDAMKGLRIDEEVGREHCDSNLIGQGTIWLPSHSRINISFVTINPALSWWARMKVSWGHYGHHGHHGHQPNTEWQLWNLTIVIEQNSKIAYYYSTNVRGSAIYFLRIESMNLGKFCTGDLTNWTLQRIDVLAGVAALPDVYSTKWPRQSFPSISCQPGTIASTIAEL